MYLEYEIDGEGVSEEIGVIYRALGLSGLITLSVDMIPYTEDFERLYERVREKHALTRNEVFTRLMNERKQGRAKAPKEK